MRSFVEHEKEQHRVQVPFISLFVIPKTPPHENYGVPLLLPLVFLHSFPALFLRAFCFYNRFLSFVDDGSPPFRSSLVSPLPLNHSLFPVLLNILYAFLAAHPYNRYNPFLASVYLSGPVTSRTFFPCSFISVCFKMRDDPFTLVSFNTLLSCTY